MNNYGQKLTDDSVRFERLLPGPVDKVWRYLTDPAYRSRWLCGGITEMRIGGRVDMDFNNASLSSQPDIPKPEKFADLPEEISFSGVVTQLEAPVLLAHTWVFEGEASEVCYELKPLGDQVRLILTHRRLSSSDEMLDVCAGWHTHLDILGEIAAGEPASAYWKRHAKLEAEYEALLSQ